MPVPWSAGLVFVGFTGLPHPNTLHKWAISLRNVVSDATLGAEDADAGFSFAPAPSPFSAGPTVSPADAAAALQTLAIMAVVMVLVVILAWLLPQIIFACLYKANVFDKRDEARFKPTPHMEQKSQFTYNLTECTANINEALCACCCPTVRFADSHGKVEGGFWGALCKFIGVNILINVLSGLVVGMLVPPAPDAAVPTDPHAAGQQGSNPADNLSTIVEGIFRGLFFGVVMRKALRAKLGDKEPGKNALGDCLSWGFLSCCALTQDSVEMDIAYDVTVGIPCSITDGRVGVKKITSGREVAPGDYEKMLGDAVEEGGR